MKERLIEFLKIENKSSAQLAEEIGVQASGISHILSGRNNPSLDFVMKMLEKYQYLSTEWLLFGKGSMYKPTEMQTLFDNVEVGNKEKDVKQLKNEFFKTEIEFQNSRKSEPGNEQTVSADKIEPQVVKIVWFFDNNSFEEYFPRR
jgi:transcriptional regulator with XRE-family HTH domain